MSGPYSSARTDALNGEASHFDTAAISNDEQKVSSMVDPGLASDTIRNVSSTAAPLMIRRTTGSPISHSDTAGHDQGSEAVASDFGEQDSSAASAPAKGGKASRACDECRRRKSKCTDGNADTGRPCAPCRARTGPDAECHYNRTPMKRGPSKGYIQAMKGNVDDVSRGQRKVLSHVDYLKIELEAVKDQLSKLVDFVVRKFGEDALEPPESREELVKRVRFSEVIPDSYILSLEAQKAVAQYQVHFQNVLPLLPTDPMVLQTMLDESDKQVKNAFELALQALDTPVYAGNLVDQTRAELIGESYQSLAKQAYTPLYFATIAILMLAIQTTGPVSEYRRKLPNMMAIHDKGVEAYAALQPSEESTRLPEITNYIRCIAIAIRSMLMITSIGSGEIFAIIDQISIPSDDEDVYLLSGSTFRFAQLADTFHEILCAGLSEVTIQFAALGLVDSNLPSPEYKVVSATLQLMTARLNTFSEFPDLEEIVRNLNNVVDNLYLFTSPENGAPYAPSCWLYYHGLALAVKTAFDLATMYESEGDSAAQAAHFAVSRIKDMINHLPVAVLSGWEQAAMNTLNGFSSAREEHPSSAGRWRLLLAKNAYLRALDF